MKRFLVALITTISLYGALAAAPASAMRAECQAHADTANWCFNNGYTDWGNLEYAAYISCLGRD